MRVENHLSVKAKKRCEWNELSENGLNAYTSTQKWQHVARILSINTSYGMHGMRQTEAK